MPCRAAKALAFPGVGEATARICAWLQERRASACKDETNCEPIKPTPTRFVAESFTWVASERGRQDARNCRVVLHGGFSKCTLENSNRATNTYQIKPSR